MAFESPEAAAREIKRAALAFGAGDVGIAACDGRWMYSAKMGDVSSIE